MMAFSKTAALVLGALTMAIAPLAAGAAPHKNLGGARGGAKSSVSHGGGGGGANRGGGGANKANYNKPNGGNNKPNRGGKNNVTINNNNNVNVSGNNRGGGGRYNNGYNNNGHWDNDDNDFLEFVGKTAAITAGVSVVAAVIGSSTNERPSDCQEVVSNGQLYMNCNGTWYQPMQSGSQTQYTVIAPPR